LVTLVRNNLESVEDPRKGAVDISIGDALMSGFAMFCLKDPSLLAFEERRKEGDPNLREVFGIDQAPSDTRMREILDEVDPRSLDKSFNDIFAQIQRGKGLEQLKFLGKYLISGDGTGFFFSTELSNDSCLEKVNSKTGRSTYHQSFYGAALVHPDYREVIAFAPELIVKQDGESKNDSEREGAKRFFRRLRKDHPHLPVIVVEDALHSNAPHIRELMKLEMSYLIGVKENDHKHLFKKVEESMESGESTRITRVDPDDEKKRYCFHFVNGVPLNKGNPDLEVNFLECWETLENENGEVKKETHYSWVTDLEITEENVYEMMRGGRARWKIENETFNTLKNQGYHLEHNYGLGENYLSHVFLILMMLAFLMDQTQQLCCGLFRAAWEKVGSKRSLWEIVRSVYRVLYIDSMEMLYKIITFGHRGEVSLEKTKNSE
jgi:hypothetical protein